MKKWVLLAIIAMMIPASSFAACPSNPSGSVTIPLSGSAVVQVCDQAGNVLSGPYTVNLTNGNGPVVNSTTSPSGITSAGNLQFAANGAASGTAGVFYICFTPAVVCSTMNFSVGPKVTAISFGTTTP